MDNVQEGQANADAGIVNENVYVNQPAAKKQRRAPKGMPQMDLNAPGLFTIVPQVEGAGSISKPKQEVATAKQAKKKPPLPREPVPQQMGYKPAFKVPPNVMVYPAHMMPVPMAPPPHPFSQPFAVGPPGNRMPLAQPMFSYTGSQELIPAPTFAPLIDVKIRKLQHLATMRELDIEESTVLKALLQLQKQKMMKALEFMKMVLPEAQAREDKPKRMLHRLERAGVKDGHISVVALVKRRDMYYVCSALDGIPSDGISAVLRLLPGEGVSKPRKEASAPEERVDAVLPKPEDFEKLVRFMGTPNTTGETRRKCLLAFMCHCYGGRALHAAGYIHACNQVISAEKGTTLARKFQKAQRIDELFSRKPGQGMKRKGEGEAGEGFGAFGGGLLGLVAPEATECLPEASGGPPKSPLVKAARARKGNTKKGAAAVPLEGGLLRAAAADDQQGAVVLNDNGYESDVLIIPPKEKKEKQGPAA